MNDQLKRRLLGGCTLLLLLGLLVIVFQPRLFTYSSEDLLRAPPPTFVELKIRPAPPPSQAIEAKLDRLKDNAQPQAKDEPASPTTKAPVQDAAEGLDAVSFDERGIPIRWVVQVASLGTQEEAAKLKQQLADKGFTTFSHVHKQDDTIIYAVYVGPTLQRVKADRHKAEIDKLFNTEGLIRKWN